MVRRGILGGTFNPIHLGHLEAAKAAKEALELEEVMIVPAAQNPHKGAPAASPIQRLQMAQLVAEDHDWLSISDLEMTRGGPSYTIDTFEELSLVMPGEYWVIIGSDALLEIERWKRWEQLVAQVRFAAIMREGEDFDSFLSRLPEQAAHVTDHVPMQPSSISGTRIRADLPLGRPVHQLVPAKVWKYMQEVGLYQ